MRRTREQVLEDERKRIKRCKIGTMPGIIILDRRYKVEVGKRIRFRTPHERYSWQSGRVTQINPDGFFFLEL